MRLGIVVQGALHERGPMPLRLGTVECRNSVFVVRDKKTWVCSKVPLFCDDLLLGIFSLAVYLLSNVYYLAFMLGPNQYMGYEDGEILKESDRLYASIQLPF